MPELPQVNGDRVLRALRRAGWYVHRITGSHHVLKNDSKPGRRVVVPVHRAPLRRGTLADILKQADMFADEFKELL